VTPIIAFDAPRTIVHMVFTIISRALFSLRVRNAGAMPRRGPCVVAANHSGYLDPMLLQMGTPRPLRYLLTSNFFDIPAARPFFRLSGAIRVPEGRLARGTVRGALAVLDRGGAVGIFPEGRLSRTGEIGPFRPGVAFLAARGRAPVVPAHIRGSFRVWPKGHLLPRQATVEIRFGEPLRISDARDEGRIRDAVLALGA
jgi:1-acyl-sn-glycerol-3-phosphate acyltransferase